MIPKKIHYCWYGPTPKPKLALQCIESWKKYNPDYEIIEWNEKNSPIHLYPYAQQAMEAKKYAFVSDVIRLHALREQGGFYMDTDVELLRSLEPLRQCTCITGYERDFPKLQTAFMAAEADTPWVNDCLAIYQNITFKADRSSMSALVNNHLLSNLLRQKGIELNWEFYQDDYITIYPADYFCPMSFDNHSIVKSPNTYCIHYYSFSWSRPETLKGWIRYYAIKLLGEKEFRSLVNKFSRNR